MPLNTEETRISSHEIKQCSFDLNTLRQFIRFGPGPELRSVMFRVYTCLTVDHDWRLVVLAVVVCFLASAVAISLFHRAQATIERTRIVWLGLDAVAAGYGIWATHFIAMLAYDPGIGAGYNLVVTILSLLIAVLVTGVGLGIALFYFGRWTAVLGGAVVGSGIAAMHYTGMMALEVPGRITWLPNLVVASVVLGIAFGAFSVFFAARRDDWLNTLIAIFLLTLRDRRHALHGHGRRVGHARSGACQRRNVRFARLTLPRHCRCSGNHSRHMSGRGIERSAIKREAAATENPARHCP